MNMAYAKRRNPLT